MPNVLAGHATNSEKNWKSEQTDIYTKYRKQDDDNSKARTDTKPGHQTRKSTKGRVANQQSCTKNEHIQHNNNKEAPVNFTDQIFVLLLKK